MNKKIIEQKAIWRNLAWVWGEYTTPPVRPCKSLLKIWEAIVKEISKKVKNPKALILGSTPEFRDLVLKYNFESMAYDINSNMLEAMERLMKQKNHPKNKKIAGNWLKMNFRENSLDLVLGHWSVCQLFTQKEVKTLFYKLRKFLKPDGLLLIAEIVREKKKPAIRGEDWKKWLGKYKKKKVSECELYCFLKYQSDWNSYPKSPSLLGTLSIYKRIKKFSQKDNNVKKFYLWWAKVLGARDKRVLIFLRKDFKELLGKYFKLLPIKQCYDYSFCKYTPFYLGKPKKK